MPDIEDKVKVKTCFKFDASSCVSSGDEEDMSYDVLLQNCHMISLSAKFLKKN